VSCVMDMHINVVPVEAPIDDSFVPPFEGPEKLLEIWFAPNKNWIKLNQTGGLRPRVYGLRTIPRSVWDEVLSLVKCKIINVLYNDDFDAYLLSESSMFIWNNKLILKTCGTTTTLFAVPRILEEARNVGLVHVDNVFYSRKRFLFPDRQQPIHSKFDHEVEFLDNIFDDGSAYSLGTLDDSWNLYITEHKTASSDSEDEGEPAEVESVELPPDSVIDQTLEILMHDLDPSAMVPFWKNEAAGFSTASDSTEKSGIADFFPGAQLDAFLFDPCGYSLNGIVGASEQGPGGYFTIHITPQRSCSYVSFETNVELKNYDELIRKVLNTFKPNKYIISFFSNEGLSAIQSRVTWDSPEKGYVQGAKTYYNFEEYSLMFVQAKKKSGGNERSQSRNKHVQLKQNSNPISPVLLRPRTPG